MEINRLIKLQIDKHNFDDGYEVYIEIENSEDLICIFFPNMFSMSFEPITIGNTASKMFDSFNVPISDLYNMEFHKVKLSISDFGYEGYRNKVFYVKRGKFTEEEIKSMRNE